MIFRDFKAMSALQLNVEKTVVVPLWIVQSHDALAKLIGEHALEWKNIIIADCCKYLGFLIGPGVSPGSIKSWEKP